MHRCLHRAPNDAAIGKTAMAHITKDDKAFPFKVILVDSPDLYADFASGYIRVNEDDIIIFDRMDLYGTKRAWENISKIRNRCVLVDAKYLWCNPCDYIMAKCEWTETGLRVSD